MLFAGTIGRNAAGAPPKAALAVAAGLVLLAGLVAHHGDYDAGWLGIIPIFHALAHSLDPLEPTGSIHNSVVGVKLNNAYDVATFNQSGSVYVVAAAFTSDYVQIVDVTDPTNPSHVDNIRDGTNALNDPTAIDIFHISPNTYAAVTSWSDNGVQVLDITDPYNIMEAGQARDSSQTNLREPHDISVFTISSHTYAVVASVEEDGVQVLNLTDIPTITPVSNITDSITGITIDGPRGIDTFSMSGYTYAIVTSYWDDAIQVLNLTDPSAISGAGKFIDTWETKIDKPYGVDTFKIGGFTYAVVTANEEDGVQVFNLTDIPTIKHIDYIVDNDDTVKLNGPRSIKVFNMSSNTYAAVAVMESDALQVLNLTDLSNISPVANLVDTSSLLLDDARGVDSFVLGDSTYLAIGASRDDGIQIVHANMHATNSPPALRVSTAIVHEDTSEQLNAWATDPDGDIMTYNWTQKSPSTPRVAFDNHTILRPTVTGPDVSGVGSTTFILTLNATDQHGLSSTKDTELAVWGNSRPTVDAGANQIVSEGDTVQLDGHVNDPNNDPMTYLWTYTPATPAITLSNSTILNPTFTAPEVSADVTYTFTLNATDHHGAYRTDTVQITVKDNRPPSVVLGPNREVNERTTYHITANVIDPEGDTPITYQWGSKVRHGTAPPLVLVNNDTDTVTITTHDVSGDSGIEHTYVLYLNATDSRGAVGYDEIIFIVKSNQPPTIDLGNPRYVNENTQVTINSNVTDPEGDIPITYKWWYVLSTGDDVPINLGDDTGDSVTFTTPFVDRQTVYKIYLNATDSLGALDYNYMVLAIDNVANQPPVIDAGNNRTVNEGDRGFTLSGTASDPENNPLTYRWTYTPSTPAFTISNDRSDFTNFVAPYVTVDTVYTFTFTVSDGYNTVTDTLTITVRDVPNEPPTIDAGDDFEINEGDTGYLTGTATDQEHDALSYRWTYAPSTTPISIGDDTALSTTFTAPAVSTNTTFTFTLTVRDSNNVVRDTLAVTVLDVPSPPPEDVDAGEDQSVNEGDVVMLSGSATEPDNEPMTYHWSCDPWPTGPAVPINLGDASKQSVLFTAPQVPDRDTPFIADDTTAYTCTFTAADSHGSSASDTMTLIVHKIPEDGPVLTLYGDRQSTILTGSTWTDPGASCVTMVDGTPLGITVSATRNSAVIDVDDLLDTTSSATYDIKYSCGHNGQAVSETRAVSVIYGSNAAPEIGVTTIRTEIGDSDGDTDFGSDAACSDREDGGLPVTSSVTYNGDRTKATITYACTDSAGSSASATQDVTVASSSPPEIHLNGTGTHYMTVGDEWDDPGAYCTDAEDGKIAAPAMSEDPDTDTPGQYIISYKCADSHGNEAATARNVFVNLPEQDLPPVLTISDTDITIPVNGTWSTPDATCADKEDGDLTDIIWMWGADDVNVAEVGVYTIFYFCTDSADQEVQDNVNVTVKDDS